MKDKTLQGLIDTMLNALDDQNISFSIGMFDESSDQSTAFARNYYIRGERNQERNLRGGIDRHVGCRSDLGFAAPIVRVDK